MNIVAVEDSDKDFRVLKEYIARYYEKSANAYTLQRFQNAERFLDNYRCEYDVIFMDIELTGEDGMSASRRIREIDSNVVIVFITNMRQFAVKGYEVNALDFIVKPLQYSDFRIKFARVENMVEINSARKYFTVRSEGEVIRFKLSDLMYVEAQGHYLQYHIIDRVYSVYGQIGETERQLAAENFLRCNRSFIVNAFFIARVKESDIYLKNGEIIPISRTKKKEFMQQLTVLLGNGL